MDSLETGKKVVSFYEKFRPRGLVCGLEKHVLTNGEDHLFVRDKYREEDLRGGEALFRIGTQDGETIIHLIAKV